MKNLVNNGERIVLSGRFFARFDLTTAQKFGRKLHHSHIENKDDNVLKSESLKSEGRTN